MNKKLDNAKCVYCGTKVSDIVKTQSYYEHLKEDEKKMDMIFEKEQSARKEKN